MFAAVLALSLPSFADFLLDNLEGSTSANALNGYWYVYASGYNNDKPIATSFSKIDDAAQGKVAALDYNGLSTKATAPYPVIGIGTNISPDSATGIGSEFANVNVISFKAKGPVGLQFNFNVETTENTNQGKAKRTDNSYTKRFTIEQAGWKEYNIPMKPVTATAKPGVEINATNFPPNAQPDGKAGDLKQDPYTGNSFTFVPSEVTKISWSLKVDKNNGNALNTSANVNIGVFAVDDIKFIGAFEAPPTGPVEVTGDSTLWRPNFVVPTPSALFSNFENDLKGALGYYWYTFAYGGAEIAKEKRDAGRSGAGTAAFGEFTVGAGAEGPVSVIGVDFYDDKATTKSYWDAKDFTGVYFEYKTTAGVNPLTVELHDKYSAENPESGLTFTVDLPGTSGEWKAAVVNFDKFKLPSWADGEQKRNLGVTALAKLHFVYKGATSGSIGIDNVYFLGTGSFGEDEVEPPIVPPVVVDTNYVLKYIAGAGGKLSVAGVTKQEYDTTVVENGNGPAVTAVADEGYKFVKWSDGFAVAARTGDIAVRDSTMTAQFEVNVVVPDSFTVTYNAGNGGKLHITFGTDDDVILIKDDHSFKGEAGDTVPVLVKAVADSGYRFVSWNDGDIAAVREGHIVSKDTTFIANFILVNPDVDPEAVLYTLTYSVSGSGGGRLTVGEDTKSSFLFEVEKDSLGFTVKAVADSGYKFVGWSDGFEGSERTDRAVSDSTITAVFEVIVVSVAQTDRVVPPASGSEIVVVAPVTVVAGEFAAGPNPAAKQSGEVRFFWSGRAVKSGKLAIFDASGNLVKKVNVGESASGRSVFGFARGAIGSWDLKDAKGRPVAEGTYLVKGVIVTQDGAKVKASAVLGVR